MTTKATAALPLLGRARLSARAGERGYAAKLSQAFAGSVASEAIHRTVRSDGPHPNAA